MRKSATITTSRKNYLSDAKRWSAVIRRDRTADGHFVYSVKTTGVYCRPSCVARKALRSNVAFHLSCEQAEAAGFRPCKRCEPNGKTLDAHYAEAIAKACHLITTADEAPSLASLAKAVGISPFHFQRLFKRMLGLTPKAYATAHRSERMRNVLQKRNTVTEAIYEAGYKSSGRFYADSSRTLGMSPSDFRKGGSGTMIRFAVGKCSLGIILVASSEKGICAILLGDDPNALTQDLQRRFSEATIIAGDKAFEKLVAAVISLVEEPQQPFDLPLDVQGTAFQQRVWNALRGIPVGTTANYTEIAKQIGLPKAVRAVAQACGANAHAIVIPCHRVVRRDGNLSGYRWGIERKRTLLQREAATRRR
jgi:AraC family transcriptional regulator of adaptative response/methylated-DNA-[protein]-cysteine methyltransferase